MGRNKISSYSPSTSHQSVINNVQTSIDDVNVSDEQRYSSHLQPIREELFSNGSNELNSKNSVQYFQQAIVNGASSSSSLISNRTIVVPKTDGYVNLAYETDYLDLSDKCEKNYYNLPIGPCTSSINKKSFANEESFIKSTEYKQSLNQIKLTPQKLKTLKEKDQINVAEQSNRKDTKERLPEWDRFETLPPPDEDETQESEWVEVAIKWLKLFSYFFTFVMVLLLSVCSKTIILLMISMTAVDHTVSICNTNEYYYIDPPLDHDKRYITVYRAQTPTRIAWLWSLYFATIAPYIFAFLRSVRIIYFKTFKIPQLQTMLTVFVAETLHCIGLSLFIFVILPQLDVIKGAMMMNSVCFIPSVIRLFVSSSASTDNSNSNEIQLPIKILLSQTSTEESINEYIDYLNTSSSTNFDHLKLNINRNLALINFSLQCLIITCWTIVGFHSHMERFYLIPVAMILISFEWWENYVIPDSMKSVAMFLSRARNDLIKTRYFVFAFITPWKILLIFLLMVLNEYVHNGSQVTQLLFQNFTDSFNADTVSVIRDKRNYDSHILLDTDYNRLYVDSSLWPVRILLVHVAITYLNYAFAKFTCKVCFQSISFAIPLCLAVPTTVSLLWGINSVAFQDKCQLVDIFKPFQFIFWNQGTINIFTFNWFNILVIIVWMVSYISQITNTLHIWKETSESLASTEQLFVSPKYNAIMIDQSLVLNRRCLKLIYSPDYEDRDEQKDIENNAQKVNIKTDPKSLLEPQLDTFETNKISEVVLEDQPRNSYNPLFEWNTHMENLMNQSKFPAPKLNDDDDDWTKDWHRVCEMMGVEEDSIDAKTDSADDETIRIYICATMWHEDRNEMLQMLKAVMRLDYEQGLRRIAKKEFGDDVKKVIYEMEVNIYFDDAFSQGPTKAKDDRVINRYVEQLIDTIGDAANQVFAKNLDLEPLTVVPTPYGGKLIWKMPMGTNRLIAHIKDKNLIRHRKRWSQCMYMYYLLGYRLASRKDLDINRKKTIMNNTFILALDGDINFRPQAVDLVVDLMKKNNNLGAACGRIHPIGSGPIVWYQKFEYAMGHWLQKATEHVIGCVLCSPGCFSLFRARALMDKSVMNKYTTKPSAAQHYVQYDQGEDRWLCTLLLQRGWRIEYCAASDSYTHAPERFSEFYTQRRRWGPSTMANILDLLTDYKQTVKMNDNISYLYIMYQAFLMLGTIISPGTIFLMVVSAMNIVMGISTQMSLIYNMVPLLAFMFVCLKFESNDTKITFATILSVIYALLMLAVLVGTGIDMYTQGFFSPNSLFFSAMIASFIIAAILHPQEFTCVLPLPIYMLFIPSMYMLLTIYSITNMNVVVWGTRESEPKSTEEELARQKKEEEARAIASKKKKKSDFLNISNIDNKNGLFTCLCCSDTNNDEMYGTILGIKSEVKEISKLLNNELEADNTKRDIVENCPDSSKAIANSGNIDGSTGNQINKDGQLKPEQQLKREMSNDLQPSNKEMVMKPKWIRNNARLNSCPIKFIPAREEEFWKKMMAKYLYPLDEDKKEKERIRSELANLRNKFVFAFAFLNIIFILFVFMLQLHKDVFGIDIPVGFNGTTEIYNEEEDKKIIITNVIKTRMDPINLTLVCFFGAILIIQCIGMFIHRFGTLAHLLAYTEIWEKKKKFDYSSFVAQLIKEKATRYGKKRRHRDNRNQPDNNIKDDDEHHSDNDVKPSEYGDVVGQVIQELKSDQSQLEKMSKMMRKNTKHAIQRHQQNKNNQAKRQQHRDSIISTLSLEREYPGSQFQHHRRVSKTASNQSTSTQHSLQIMRECETFTNNPTAKERRFSISSNQSNLLKQTETGLSQVSNNIVTAQPMSTFSKNKTDENHQRITRL